MHDGFVGKTGHYGAAVTIVLCLHEGCNNRGNFHFRVMGFPSIYLTFLWVVIETDSSSKRWQLQAPP
jgi:hypothetical protein